MRLNFVRSYKSIIGPVADGEISNLVVLSGLNGTGKSHLLEAIADGAITVDDVQPQSPRGPRRPRNSHILPGPVRLFRLNELAVAQDQGNQGASRYRNSWKVVREEVKRVAQELVVDRPDFSPGSEEYEQDRKSVV